MQLFLLKEVNINRKKLKSFPVLMWRAVSVVYEEEIAIILRQFLKKKWEFMR